MSFEVRTTALDGVPTAIGAAGPFTLVADRPEADGGGGPGFNGGQLLYLAIAGCVSNDLHREAARRGTALRRVEVRVDGGFTGDPAVSAEVTYDVTVTGTPTSTACASWWPTSTRSPRSRTPCAAAPPHGSVRSPQALSDKDARPVEITPPSR